MKNRDALIYILDKTGALYPYRPDGYRLSNWTGQQSMTGKPAPTFLATASNLVNHP
jgi:hypothetical protein